MSTQKILFPTDFSDQSIHALMETVKFNEALGYDIVLFHAYNRPYTDEGYNAKGLLHEEQKSIDKKFSAVESKMPALKNCTTVKMIGDVVDVVEDYIEKEPIALIVMSTKGAAGLGELFGTKTAKIIKNVNVPVIVVPNNAVLAPMNRIGLACDYTEVVSPGKLDFLVDLADKVQFDLDLITLNRDEKTMTKKELGNREILLKDLNGIATTTSFSQHDQLSWGLIEFARNNGIEMIGVIPKSYNFIERIFHESLTQEMAFHSPVPVLVIQ